MNSEQLRRKVAISIFGDHLLPEGWYDDERVTEIMGAIKEHVDYVIGDDDNTTDLNNLRRIRRNRSGGNK